MSAVATACCCESGPDQSKDQRIQHEVRRAVDLWGTSKVLDYTTHLMLIFFSSSSFNLLSLNSAPSSRSEPSPKPSRQSLSIKPAFLGGKTDGKIHSTYSPKTGEEQRAIRVSLVSFSVVRVCNLRYLCMFDLPDESSPPRDRGTWKIAIPGIIRKPFEKKTPAGITFGVRLDDCPPAQSNEVGLLRFHRLACWHMWWGWLIFMVCDFLFLVCSCCVSCRTFPWLWRCAARS